jgi:hypothetical protein
MEQVLDVLRWKPPAKFAARVSRLTPRGPAPPMRSLRDSDIYRQALTAIGEIEA